MGPAVSAVSGSVPQRVRPTAPVRSSIAEAAPARLRPRYSPRGARVVAAGFFGLAVVGVGAAAARAAGYRVNVSASVPLGLWRLAPDLPLRRGAMTLWCPPDNALFRAARAHRSIPYGLCPGRFAPLFKPAAAVAGDVVEVTPSGIRVNGVALPNTAQRPQEGKGAWLPLVPVGTYRVPAGKVWFVSTTNPYSFDARYYGPMPVSRVQGVARPVWTWDPYAAAMREAAARGAAPRAALATPAAAGEAGRP